MTSIAPRFTEDTAKSTVQLAQELWNTCDPLSVSQKAETQ
jgi:hypothetical protein